ncbi:MAG: DNA cytosine methyltransferase [Amaricoccus sp.]|uniref:DNA cytosine methyltransferase n=1 Tax=Amaricoccus sp. TaxID=1872485 RepID=UPI0033145198
MADLKGAAGPGSYRLVALCRENRLDFNEEPKPAEFLVRAEEHGVPQARHRVIIVGLRSDIVREVPAEFVPRLRRHSPQATVQDVIGGLDSLRSGLSTDDGVTAWEAALAQACDDVDRGTASLSSAVRRRVLAELNSVRGSLQAGTGLGRVGSGCAISSTCHAALKDWIVDPALRRLPNHETRSHMEEDLGWAASAIGVNRVSRMRPGSSRFPERGDHRAAA